MAIKPLDLYIDPLCILYDLASGKDEDLHLLETNSVKSILCLETYLGVGTQLFFKREHRLNIMETTLTL